MAIQFARIEIATRSKGDNACCKGAYNARSKITDQKTGVVYNFTKYADNVYHIMLLPEGANEKYKDSSVLANEVERTEKKSNSQLLKEVVIALPDDKELNLKDRIEITHRIIDKMEWVKNGLAVQVDIHEPHDGENNWHAHLLVTTRRFTKDGLELGEKARDLNPEFKNGKNGSFIIPEEEMIHEKGRDIINEYFKEKGLSNRVDEIGKIAQEHIGPRRMRAALNQKVMRNEEKKEAEIKYLNSGERVIEKITTHMSVFNENDIKRALKIHEDENVREKLFQQAIESKELVELFESEASLEPGKELKPTGFYTTKAVRLEEEKLLRLGAYIDNNKSVFSGKEARIAKILGNIKSANKEAIAKGEKSFNEEQIAALEYMLSSDSSLKILRGRAGTGKSHVFGQLARVCGAAGVNIVGLAPTHKARLELAGRGFEKNDTVKGMLFKIKNNRFDLRKGSLIVVDEAGMIANDDLMELQRVAASYKCNVIMGGDERQLASPSRGGMFEVFSERFTSCIMSEIRRQENEWGRFVASRLSQGDVRGGLVILQEEGKIREDSNRVESMQALLKDWHNSGESLDNKMILAVKNADVDLLNKGARQYLKASGDLDGPEFDIKGKSYCIGDKILFTKTDKDLGLTNGDFADIIYASKDKFLVMVRDAQSGANDNRGLIEFNPSEYNGFRHGYATTIFKAQGASIRDVFLFHGGFAGLKNSYVGLSRNINNLRLYINKEATKSFGHLVKQMSQDPEISSSLAYKTKEDIEKELARAAELENSEKKQTGFLGKVVSQATAYAKGKFTEITDKYSIDQEYYNYKPDPVGRERVEEVFELFDIAEEEISTELAEERGLAKAAGGEGSSILEARSSKVSTKPAVTWGKSSLVPRGNQTPKQRFYSKADFAKLKEERRAAREEVWSRENEQLKHRVKIHAEDIATKFLGQVNRKMSYGDKIRFGESGKIIVRLTDGSWHDFSTAEGGDMFKLVQREMRCDFKAAEEYLRDYLGLARESTRESSKNTSHLRVVANRTEDHRLEDKIKAADAVKRQQERDDKIGKAIKLYARSKDLHEASVAASYLSKTRCIDAAVVSKAGDDVRTAGIRIGETSGDNPIYAPALIGFARNEHGEITGGQYIVLDKKTAGKAKIDVPKKSFGVISGSFVEVFNSASTMQKTGDAEKVEKVERAGEGITIIAEGLETALSVAQSADPIAQRQGIGIKVICSLGISNMRSYAAKAGEKIIIAADNDGKESRTDGAINMAKEAFKDRGAIVEIARPTGAEKRDFNDMLQRGEEKELSALIRTPIEKHEARSLRDYFGAGKDGAEKDEALAKALPINGELQLTRLRQYNILEETIVESFRVSELRGKSQLHHMWKIVGFAEYTYAENKEMFEIAANVGARIDKPEAVASLMIDQERFDEKVARMKAAEIVLAKIEEKKQKTEEQFNLYTRKYIKSRLDQFNKSKKEAKDSDQLFEEIKAEQRFLSSLDNDKLTLLDVSVIAKALALRDPQTKEIMVSIEKSLLVHKKQGLGQNEELMKLILSKESNLEDLASAISKQVESNRSSYLMPIHIEQAELEKLGCKLDKDELVENLST